jgi:hypothetical protein
MATAYPAAIDNFNLPTAANNLSDAPVIHHSQHSDVNAAVRAIELELGTLPKGASADVKTRLNAIEASISGLQASSAKGAPNGYAGLDAGSMLAQNVDAGKITSGSIAVARIPNLSGAKILGTGSGGATIPLDAVPNLAAAQTTSGVFAVARIPDFDAAKIISGTIAAARLPSTVTANANATVVADVAGMLAIPLINRVDGMMVLVKSPWTLYTYRADNNTFIQSGGPGAVSEPVMYAEDAADYLNVGVTVLTSGVNCGFAFKGPQSGRIMVAPTMHASNDTAGLFCYLSYEVRSGAVVGSGGLIHTATTEEAYAIGGGAATRGRGSALQLMAEALGPGADYNIRTMHTAAGAAGTFDIFFRAITVIPVH